MIKLIASIIVGIIFGIFGYFVTEAMSVKAIMDTNPDIWEVVRVRGLEIICVIGSIATGATGTWMIMDMWQKDI